MVLEIKEIISNFCLEFFFHAPIYLVFMISLIHENQFPHCIISTLSLFLFIKKNLFNGNAMVMFTKSDKKVEEAHWKTFFG